MEDVIKYINENREAFINELKDFLKIPSNSTLFENKKWPAILELIRLLLAIPVIFYLTA